MSNTIVSQILPFGIALFAVASTGWLVGLLWARGPSIFSAELDMKIAFVGGPQAGLSQENRFLLKTHAREFRSLPLSKFIKFGRLKRRFPVNSTDWMGLVDKLHDNGEQLLKIASVDAIIAVVPLAGNNYYNLKIISSPKNNYWFEPDHPGYQEFGPFEINERDPKFVVGALGTLALYAPVITDRMTFAAGSGLRRRYLSSLQQMERRLALYKDDLDHIARPNFTFSLKRLEAWLQLTLGRLLSDESRLERSRLIVCSNLEAVPNDIPAAELAKTWSLLAFINREIGKNSSGTELLEQSVDAARNAVGLWKILSTRESTGHLAGLRDLTSDCLAIVGERQTDNDRLLQAADQRIQATDLWQQMGCTGNEARSSAALGNIYQQIDKRSASRQYLIQASAAFDVAARKILDARTSGWEVEASGYFEHLGDVYLELGRRELDSIRLRDACSAFGRALGYGRARSSGLRLKRLCAKRARARYFCSGLSGSKSQVEDALVDFEFANNGMDRPEFSVKTEFDVESVLFHARSLVRLGKISKGVRYYDEATRILERLSTLLQAGIETRLRSDIELARGEAYQLKAKLTDALADWLQVVAIFSSLQKNPNFTNALEILEIQNHLAESLLAVTQHQFNTDKDYLSLAIDKYQQTLFSIDEQAFPIHAGHCYFGLAEGFSRRGERKRNSTDTCAAVKGYEKALECWRSQGMINEQVRTLCRLGTVLRDSHQVDGGLDSLRKSVSAFGQAKDLVDQTDLEYWAESIRDNLRISEDQIAELRLRGTYTLS